MKSKSLAHIKKNQHGFAMLEVMLAILIIAIASFGIYKLFSSSSTRNGVSGAESVITQINSAASQYFSNYLTNASSDELVNYLPKEVLSADRKTIITPLGTASYASGSDNNNLGFTITLNAVPKAAVPSLKQDLSSMYDVTGDDTSDTNKLTLVFPKKVSS